MRRHFHKWSRWEDYRTDRGLRQIRRCIYGGCNMKQVRVP